MDDAQIEENLKKAQSIDLTWAKKLKAGAPVYYTNGEDIHQFNFVGHIPSLLTMEKQVLAYCPKEREIVQIGRAHV